MKQTRISISQVAIAAVVAGSIYFSGNVIAQVGEGSQGVGTTSTASHPGLRRSSAPQQQVKLSEKDKNFIQNAANSGVSQVADGKFAQGRAQSAEVKKVAADMVADYSRYNKELGELGKKKGLNMDLSAGKARTLRKENYDGDYLATMESDHQADIKIFEAEAKSGDDADIKAWAAKTLPMLKSNLAMVKNALKKKQ